MDNLLLHCPVAKELWDFLFVAFGMKWVMPKKLKDLYQCRHCSSKSLQNHA